MPEWKIYFGFLLFLLLAACGGAHRNGGESRGLKRWPPSEPVVKTMPVKKDKNMYSTTDDDAEMNAAIATARRTFPRFDSAFVSGKFDKDLYMIKVRLETSSGPEYIWLTDIEKVNGRYKGIISDSPRFTTLVREGDTLAINQPDIADWIYGDPDLVHGAYTTRVILSRMTPKDRDETELGFSHHIVD